jgi:hypothetical protein
MIFEGRRSTHGLMTDHAPRLTLGRVSATLHLRRFRIEPRLLDLVFAVVLTAFGGAQVLVGHLAVGGRLVPGLAVPVLGAAVALRRRFPATAGTAFGDRFSVLSLRPKTNRTAVQIQGRFS